MCAPLDVARKPAGVVATKQPLGLGIGERRHHAPDNNGVRYECPALWARSSLARAQSQRWVSACASRRSGRQQQPCSAMVEPREPATHVERAGPNPSKGGPNRTERGPRRETSIRAPLYLTGVSVVGGTGFEPVTPRV
jgi:hypothetical protein